MNPEIKAWLGLNLQDTLINIGSVFFFVGILLTSSLVITILLFSLSAMFNVAGIVVYFRKRNKGISKLSENLNKWGSLAVVVIMFIAMIIRILHLS